MKLLALFSEELTEARASVPHSGPHGRQFGMRSLPSLLGEPRIAIVAYAGFVCVFGQLRARYWLDQIIVE